MAELERRRRRVATSSDNNHYLWPDNGYAPRGAAARVMDMPNAEILISGPSRTGKTRANLEKIHRAMQLYAGARALIVRKTRASLSETALQTFEEQVLGLGHPLREGPQRAFRQFYAYPNESRIVVGGMDKTTRIMSSEYDIIYVPEAIELALADWEALITRLSNGVLPYQQLLADTNPDRPTHWLKQRCDEGTTQLLFSDHRDNPMLWDAENKDWTPRGAAYIQKLDRLTGVRKQRYRFGKWVQAEGAVYESWDESVHLVDRFAIPESWRRIRAVDFGYTNPFVCQWWAIDPDGRMYMYRELYHTQRLVEDMAREIVRVSAGERIEVTVCDHDAEDRATLERHGVSTVAAQKAVSVGIQRVDARLRQAGDGKARVFVLRDSLIERDESLAEVGKPTCLAEEITGYTWLPAVDGRAAKEEPVKVDDHAMDTLRYAVMHIDQVSEAAIFVGARRIA